MGQVVVVLSVAVIGRGWRFGVAIVAVLVQLVAVAAAPVVIAVEAGSLAGVEAVGAVVVVAAVGSGVVAAGAVLAVAVAVVGVLVGGVAVVVLGVVGVVMAVAEGAGRAGVHVVALDAPGLGLVSGVALGFGGRDWLVDGSLRWRHWLIIRISIKTIS